MSVNADLPLGGGTRVFARPDLGVGGGAGGDRRRWGDAAKMGAWWMPRRWRPTKDAATRRNARGRRWQPAIPGSPNGATRRGLDPVTAQAEGTRGTETSQYPEEERGFP
jgi:hypothetical protein